MKWSVKYNVVAGIILALALFIGLKFYGQSKATEKIERTIRSYELQNIIQYERITFNPFSMAPSIHEMTVTVDLENTFAFDELTIYNFDFHQGNSDLELDLSYILKEIPLDKAPRILKEGLVFPAMVGMKTLSGSGDLFIKLRNDEVELNIFSGINGIGATTLNFLGDTNQILLQSVFDKLVQKGPLSLLFLSKDFSEKGLLLKKLNINFELETYLKKILALNNTKEEENQDSQLLIKQVSEKIGLAMTGSEQADQIAEVLLDFKDSPEEVKLSVEPESPVSLKTIFTAFRSKEAYRRLNMLLSN